MQKYICNICGYIYDPEVGDVENGVAPGTPFEEIPPEWFCYECGANKTYFDPYDE